MRSPIYLIPLFKVKLILIAIHLEHVTLLDQQTLLHKALIIDFELAAIGFQFLEGLGRGSLLEHVSTCTVSKTLRGGQGLYSGGLTSLDRGRIFHFYIK